MSDVNITWNGPQIVAELKAFKEDIAVKTVRASTRRIGAYLLKQVKASAPSATGNLIRNLAVRAKYIRSRGVVAAKVVINTRGKKNDPKNAFYWRFVEFDHKTRPGENAHQRVIPGQNFIRSTFETAQPQIQSMFYADLQKAIERRKAKGGV